MLRLKFCFLQGYFNNVSEYLRIGPPLYFVVKNYNYRYHSVIIFPFCSNLITFVAMLLFFLSYLWFSTFIKREKGPSASCQGACLLCILYNLIFRNLITGVWWSLFLLLLIFQPEFLPCVCERRGRGGLKGEPWFRSMFVTMLRLQYWYWSIPQLRIKTYKPVMLH